MARTREGVRKPVICRVAERKFIAAKFAALRIINPEV
jgi:hypothetical protein